MFSKFSTLIFVFIFSLVVFAQQTAPVSVSKENADALKKIEAIKPPLLPQESSAAKEKSDAEDEGLKGKVKQVVAEREEASSVRARQLSHVMNFNEKGNFLEQDYFDYQGNVYSITMYGYIDGKRVSKSKYISYDYDPPSIAMPATKPKTDEPVKKADTRYQYSYQYKYIDGKLAETQLISNTGEFLMRYVYNHAKNQIERLVYTKEGELNQKSLATLDKDGNITEEIFLGLKNQDIYGDSKHRYIYEFDKRGNWIKQTATREITKNGTTSVQPGYVKYRTITYF